MNRIVNAIYQYESDFDAYPSDLSVLKLEGLHVGSNGSINPREGFTGYHFEPPEMPLVDIEIEELTELAVLFEIRDDGTIAYDSGVIGYADGRVEYIEEQD